MSGAPEDVEVGDVERRTGGQRYASNDVDDADPEDAAPTSLIERARNNKLRTAFLVLVTLVLLGLAVQYAAPLFAPLRDPLTYAILGVIGVVFGIFMLGRRSYASQHRDVEKLVIKLPNGATVFEGERRDADAERFDVIKGYRWLGFRASYLTVADVDSRILSLTGVRGDRDDRLPVHIPSSRARTGSDDVLGDVTVVQASDLRLTHHEGQPILLPKRPDTVDRQSYHRLHAELEDATEYISELEQQRETLRNRAQEAEQEARRARQEAVDEFVDRYKEMREAENETTQVVESRESSVAEEVRRRARDGGDR